MTPEQEKAMDELTQQAQELGFYDNRYQYYALLCAAAMEVIRHHDQGTLGPSHDSKAIERLRRLVPKYDKE